jgi:hypothetical protein
VLSIHNPALSDRNPLPHALRQDLLGRESGGGDAEPHGFEPGTRENVIQKFWTGQMRSGDHDLERSPPNQLLGSHCDRAGAGAEHHVAATAQQPAQIFTNEHRRAATLCEDDQTVGRARPADPGTDLRSVVNKRDKL